MKRHRKSGLVLLGFAAIFFIGTTVAALWTPAPKEAAAKTIDQLITGSITPPPVQKGPSGLPLPRFVSLKSDRVNVRAGPGQDYPVTWIFNLAGMPVEIIAEFENWRRIRDSEGAEGWIYHSLLSGRRTGVITPWEGGDKVYPMFSSQEQGRIVAHLRPNLVVNIHHCDSQWCEIATRGYEGYVPQKDLWGVYPGEIVED
ncbi:MAG: SH3 domain-containing protein [Flavobacteriaceae bacterium]